ncbi:hypothetical protein POF50_021730 [Streptomyces sp. SL13]|uniref:Uncharacterized protein n=1 Tax=Streptantibioticus silvisoli TaxID=2705255 RepID=A0AA90KAC0_9ACTN|nr:hypothetical protein [Streptantibioticus silvisoli]MDI5971922.1 hypothetical protein [Streptantibioticus silvisoli]
MEDLSRLDEGELYERMMRSAGPIPPCGAAVRLVFLTPALRVWLMNHGLVRADMVDGRHVAVVSFADAFELFKDFYGRSMLQEKEGIGDSEVSVLWIAASLWGVDVGTLRHVMTGLEKDHAGLAAEAMMYAAGFMDNSADPESGEVDGYATGPLAMAHEERWDW